MQFHIQFSSSHNRRKASKPSRGQKEKGGTKASDEMTKTGMIVIESKHWV